MPFTQWIGKVNDIVWGPWMLLLLIGTGVYLSYRVGFIQFTKFGYVLEHTVGRLFRVGKAAEGEVTPFQAVSTALAATVGTGNIAGVTGAICVGGPGAVFWMWVSALFGMVTKYAEVVLAIHYRQKNSRGDWVGGPMYYIRKGLGDGWNWLSVCFSLLGALAAFGIGNMTQVHTIADTINTTIDAFGGNTGEASILILGQSVPGSCVLIGVVVALVVAMVLFGGVKRIGSVAEKIVPFMAAIYIFCTVTVIISNLDSVGTVFGMIIRGAFSPDAAIGGAFGITVMTAVQKGVGRGVFSNEAGLGSAPMAHAASSESNPVKQGLYGIFEVFMDTIVICTLTAFTLLCSLGRGVQNNWGQAGGAELISASFASVFGDRLGALIVSVSISLFALTTILSWALYGSRCCEYILGTKSVTVYQILFVLAIVIGAALELNVVWSLAEVLNGLMAIPNLIALLGLSGVVIRLTKEHFGS